MSFPPFFAGGGGEEWLPRLSIRPKESAQCKAIAWMDRWTASPSAEMSTHSCCLPTLSRGAPRQPPSGLSAPSGFLLWLPSWSLGPSPHALWHGQDHSFLHAMLCLPTRARKFENIYLYNINVSNFKYKSAWLSEPGVLSENMRRVVHLLYFACQSKFGGFLCVIGGKTGLKRVNHWMWLQHNEKQQHCGKKVFRQRK